MQNVLTINKYEKSKAVISRCKILNLPNISPELKLKCSIKDENILQEFNNNKNLYIVADIKIKYENDKEKRPISFEILNIINLETKNLSQELSF